MIPRRPLSGLSTSWVGSAFGNIRRARRPRAEFPSAVAFLRRGLVRPGLKKLLHPARALPLVLNSFVVALPTLAIDAAAAIASFTASLFPAFRPAADLVSRFSWPLRRRYSRAHVIADAMADVVGTQNCNAPTRQSKSIVFNACELRTGTAFRMSNERFGAWRYGAAPASELRVADAVTASAAYPPFLPPFDWMHPFERNGNTTTNRVIITDGGVFETMGVSVMEQGCQRRRKYVPARRRNNVPRARQLLVPVGHMRAPRAGRHALHLAGVDPREGGAVDPRGRADYSDGGRRRHRQDLPPSPRHNGRGQCPALWQGRWVAVVTTEGLWGLLEIGRQVHPHCKISTAHGLRHRSAPPVARCSFRR